MAQQMAFMNQMSAMNPMMMVGAMPQAPAAGLPPLGQGANANVAPLTPEQ